MSEAVSTLLSQAMALPPADRIQLAECLWQSLNESDVSEPAEFLAELRRRNAEMDEDRSSVKSHRDVMQEARKTL